MKILYKSYIHIPAKYFTDKLRKSLIIENPEYRKKQQMGVPLKNTLPMFKLYKESADKRSFRIPRYALGNYTDLPYCYENDVTDKSISIPMTVNFAADKNFSFNDSQTRTMDNTVVMLNKERGAILVAKTGEGKSLMAINILTRMNEKTLILVHKESLIHQWVSEIIKYTDLKKEDIGLLQKGKFKDGKVVIGTFQSLMRKTIGREINDLFGLVIGDEIHRVGALCFLKSFTRFSAKFRLGLSATPSREDKLEQLYYLHTSGNIIAHQSVRNTNSDYAIIKYHRKERWKFYPSFIPLKTQIINNVICDEDRNKLIYNTVDILKDRKILILGERIKHLKQIMEQLQDFYPYKNIVRFFGAESLTKKEKSQGLKQEKVKDPTQEELNNADYIVATYSKAKEGVNIPHLDCLILATPVSSITTIIQAKGRVERALEGKPQPLLIDIVDCESLTAKGMFNRLLDGMANKRIKIYTEQGMKQTKLLTH